MTEKQEKRLERRAEMVKMRQAGMAHAQIATFFGCSEKCVQRELKASGQFQLPSSFYRCRPKEQALLAGVAKGLSNKQAAMDAGYSESTAENARREILERPRVQRALKDLLAEYVPDETIALTLAQGISATKTDFFAHQGHVVSTRETVDHGMRARYLELAGKFRGLLKDPDITVPVQVVIDL